VHDFLAYFPAAVALVLFYVAMRMGWRRETAHVLLALGVLVAGTRISGATGIWGLLFWPLTFTGTCWALARGTRPAKARPPREQQQAPDDDYV
jgi:hypothetical protein